ncbi:protein of unknown function [Pararobbsia alpina]
MFEPPTQGGSNPGDPERNVPGVHLRVRIEYAFRKFQNWATPAMAGVSQSSTFQLFNDQAIPQSHFAITEHCFDQKWWRIPTITIVCEFVAESLPKSANDAVAATRSPVVALIVWPDAC